MGKSLRIGTFISVKLSHIPLASCSLINLDFLLLETAQFGVNIILPFFVFTTFGFLLYVFFLHFKQYNYSFTYSLNFYLSLEFLISSCRNTN